MARRGVVAVVVGFGWLLWPAATGAAASCAGPEVTHPVGEVDRGETITISGRGFGTDCYDTGSPPHGQGALGEPATGIEIMMVQGDRQIVVASGDADERYRFTVDVVVPAELQPGEVIVLAHSDEVLSGGPIIGNARGERMIVSGAPAPAAGRHEVKGLSPTPETASERRIERGRSSTRLIVVGGVVAAAVLATLGGWAVRRRGWR
jgi:hypothetical protein